MGRNFTKEEVIESARKANAHNFIQKLPEKYETEITERGSNFSGGQIQRIAIARAILGNPSILLLDEATSALDAESESEVQEGLNRAMKNRTVIVIAHRLATTQEADKIVVFDKGKIIEVGKHIDLLNKKGIYKELCEKQLINKVYFTYLLKSKIHEWKTNDSGNPVLTFEGKKYLINELSKDIKESIKVLQIAETQLKMHQDTLKLLSISRNTLANQLREKLKNLE